MFLLNCARVFKLELLHICRQIHITVVPAKDSNGLNNVAFVSTGDTDSIDDEVYTSPQI